MDIKKEHIILLEEIKSSKTQSININEIKFENYLQKERLFELIEDLLRYDLVETEGDNDVYFITPNAFDFLDDYGDYFDDDVDYDEDEPRKLTAEELNEKINFFGKDKTRYYVFTWIAIIGIIIVFFTYYKISVSTNEDIEKVFKSIDVEQIKEMIDSTSHNNIDSTSIND
ncbi:hypothetical protein KMW28_26120 [Flammeovirga yaeyamensis]|uniref:Uncharacterized protein n=1 Tax=Flammeovirga yaeyamensis TaxID=367791 RepID=A0AAX1N9W9_9BACT|nr:hypothetical protein [Flammeovirga yaeyamensis]MBB3699222.1 hypothetical protein [Flammeovirga yaeyamensis]NMF35515.1 hypothetical protein [Flammeovirga yaeyamensis]QWG04374.1 hypothetical protein KMW28_26120 [Flammeovirga yaeyamensis]